MRKQQFISADIIKRNYPIIGETNGWFFKINEISNNVLTLYRTSPGATTLTSTYVGEEAGGLVFNTISPDLNGGNVFQTFSFKTEAERNAYVESLAP